MKYGKEIINKSLNFCANKMMENLKKKQIIRFSVCENVNVPSIYYFQVDGVKVFCIVGLGRNICLVYNHSGVFLSHWWKLLSSRTT